MTLATKNGSIIVKDGKLAENCGCCEEQWYCYSPACSQLPIVLVISNYSSQSNTPATPLAGTKTLAPIVGFCNRWGFSYDRGPQQCKVGFSPFDQHGVFLSLVRQIIGGNDYVLSVYSYDDTTCEGVLGEVVIPSDANGCPALPASGNASLPTGNTSFSWSMAHQS